MARRRKIGVMTESFRLPVRDAVRKAAELDIDGLQIHCTYGEVEPTNMSHSARADFHSFVAGYGLAISALCADYGVDFLNPDRNDELVAKSKRCVDLALDLGTNILTTHIGTIPEQENEVWDIGIRALSDLSDYAASKGVAFACETGPEAPAVMKRFLDKIKTGAIRVNYDPANLVMAGFDQLGGVKILGDYIVHTHAKDGIQTESGGELELPLGEGKVNFPKYLALLDEVGYDGFLTIEREVGDNPAADIAKAVAFLRSMN